MNAGNRQSGMVRRPSLIIGGGALLLLLLAMAAYGYLGPVAENAKRSQRGLQGLAYLAHIRNAIEPLQEYRGLLTMRAHTRDGDPTTREEEKLTAVDNAFAALLALQADLGDPLGVNPEITTLHQEWQQIRAGRDYSDPEQVFATFTPYIARLLALHRLAVTTSALDLDPVAGTYHLIQILDLMLEYVLEPTGQIRALYAGFLASPASGHQTRDRILGRAALLDSVAARIEHHAAMALQARPDLAPALGNLPASLRLSATGIRDLIQGYPHNVATTPTDAQHFFTAATEIITDGYRLHDVALAAARDGLGERLIEARAIFRKAIPLFALIGLGTLVLVTWGLVGWRRHEQDADDLLRQSYFQRLVAELSTRFLHADSETINVAINETLRATGEFFAVDRAYLFRYSEDGKQMSNTHEWCAPGIAPQSAMLQNIPVSDFPWWQQRMHELFQAGQLFIIANVDQLPAEAAAERKILQLQKIRSLCCVPVTTNKKVVGFVGFDSLHLRHWNEDQSDHLLTVVANVLSAALERDSLERELTINAITDGLTTLYNRRHFFTRLTSQIEGFRRNRKPFAIAIFDIDHFKRLNDTYGHLAGDCVLQEFATLLRQGFRAFDIVARYGGEEFVVMLLDSDRKAAVAIAQRVLDTTRGHHFWCEGEELRITVSGGVLDATEIAEQELSPETLVAKADNRLYRAKEAGRDRVVWQKRTERSRIWP